MKLVLGIDLGSTTTKAVVLDEGGAIIGKGITNSRSNYALAADIARDEALNGARFALLGRAMARRGLDAAEVDALLLRVVRSFRREQQLAQLHTLRAAALASCLSPALRERVEAIFLRMEEAARKPKLTVAASEFFRDMASSAYGRLAEELRDEEVGFDALMGIFDKAIVAVEEMRPDVALDGVMAAALDAAVAGSPPEQATRARAALSDAAAVGFEVVSMVGTGYGRARLPFPKENIRSEILCHGLGAHATFPRTRTVLDIGGQDTKAIQVDERGIVTSFQMNDRCAAGCGRYLGYIADEMSVGVHELGPMAMQATRQVKITSTCTVFAGAELRERLSLGEKREDIVAGLHRAIILRAMALLARSGGVHDEMTFTGGVANNAAAVAALRRLVSESYGERVLNISPESIYTGALGAALFALRSEARA